MPIASELAVTTGVTATTLANTIFGDGITVNSATVTGASTAYGTFSGADATLGSISPADTGIILSTGNATDFTNSSGTTDTNTAAGTSTDHSLAGDTDLDSLSGQTTYDAVVLETNITPTGEFITMQFVFSSEEYLEYVNSGVNDAFGVWVNGTYVPFTPAASNLVSIDTINNTTSSNLYTDNPAASDTYNTEMDGLTHVLSIKAPVNPGVPNVMKIAIADGGDGSYDSNVLIAADSVQTFALAFDDSVSLEQNTSAVVDVLDNDTDQSGGGLTITEINDVPIVSGQTVTLASGETITLNGDGTLTIEADGDVGSETFTYVVEDSLGNTDVGFVTINTIADIPNDFIVEGTGGNDSIDTGYASDPEGDRIDNNDHSDGSNADSVQGGAGNDTILSGLGNDTLDGGSGDDSLTGGAGDDRFIVGTGNDTITDFNAGTSGTISDGDATNNDFVDLSGHYDNLSELYADQADDGILNQSNATDGKGRAVDYSDNTQFGSGGLTVTGASADNSSFTQENTAVVCFTEGTWISTSHGEVPVERICAGDRVLTLDHGIQRVAWIAHTDVPNHLIAKHESLRPVVLQPELTGGDRPLLVSAQHCILLQDPLGRQRLVKARHLARIKGGMARVANGRRNVRYFHILLGQHEIIKANGVWCESFYPGAMAVNALGGRDRQSLWSVLPDLRSTCVEEAYGPRARTVARFREMPEHCRDLAA